MRTKTETKLNDVNSHVNRTEQHIELNESLQFPIKQQDLNQVG